MPRAIVLGAGMVGSVIAADLAGDDDFEVTLADVRPEALEAARQRAAGRIRTVQTDCADPDAVKPSSPRFSANKRAAGCGTSRVISDK